MNSIINGYSHFLLLLEKIPSSFIALIGRFSIAAVFWQSGQTKIEGFTINLVKGDFSLGWPRLADSTLFLFKEEYQLPLIAPEIAAVMATTAEHLFPVLLLLGFATRISALSLLIMTGVIQLLVYPGAYATHGVWASVLLYLLVYGAGKFSVDQLFIKKQA
ncbi:MAG TPA: DoxX family protein [Marinospirillum sp.]|uniref:DoxX family protein n=1 Tax=Marinospirillum sp. TaxID=2183934 RepID=UPI002B4AAB4B|nr:DoxX family protein [Marinospirillum sp.]HKM16207.1 DoxX family protein [Marinospirillum sp.]